MVYDLEETLKHAEWAKELIRVMDGEEIHVEMLYTEEVNDFLKRVESAHKATDNSTLIFDYYTQEKYA